MTCNVLTIYILDHFEQEHSYLVWSYFTKFKYLVHQKIVGDKDTVAIKEYYSYV